MIMFYLKFLRLSFPKTLIILSKIGLNVTLAKKRFGSQFLLKCFLKF